jgi:membrane protein
MSETFPHSVLLMASRILRFSLRVLRRFMKNHGVLLAGGVGYNVLLSMIPLFILLCVLLTHVVDDQRLLVVIAAQVQHLAPANADIVLEAVRTFLDARDVIGVVGMLALVFFSSFAFRMLEDSIAIIFHQPDVPSQRSFWVSALLPYVFVLVLGAGLLALTLLVSMAHAANEFLVATVGARLRLANVSNVVLNLLSFLGMFMLFSAIYKVLPVIKIALWRALAGAFVATVLWEGVRLLLVYYFANISLVNAVYGSFATIIVLLLTLEVGAIILLLGAQVIAELERSAAAGLPWHTAHSNAKRANPKAP